MTDVLVELSGITKDYRGLRPLRLRELTLRAGERVAVLGLDLAATEVLVNLLTGATLPDAGDVRAFGQPTSSLANADEWLAMADRFGMVSARAVLLESLTVLQNLAMPFSLDIEPPDPDIARRAGALATAVGLPESAWTRPVADLSPADHVLVRMARALALAPPVVIVEHPTAGVPREAVNVLADRLRNAADQRNIALLALTADEAFAARVASRVLRHDPATGQLDPVRTSWRPFTWSRGRGRQ